jgi:hypothetical protein
MERSVANVRYADPGIVRATREEVPMATHEDLFEAARERYVPEIEEISQAGDEDRRAEEALADVLAQIGKDSRVHLEQLAARPNSGHEVITGVTAWASLASYATTRFYLEGPQSIRKSGGFSMKVAERLQDLAADWSPFLKRAVKTMQASSFSIQVGVPLGVAIGLSWQVSDLADTVREGVRSLGRMREKS